MCSSVAPGAIGQMARCIGLNVQKVWVLRGRSHTCSMLSLDGANQSLCTTHFRICVAAVVGEKLTISSSKGMLHT